MGFLEGTFGNILLTFLVAMVPVLELRGAIPMGIAAGLTPWEACLIAILGNLVPVPFIILFIKSIFAWLRTWNEWFNNLVLRLEQRAADKRETVEKYAFWGLAILVAVPLPGTGAWTGSLVAAMMDMPLKKAFPAIVLGVVIAAVIVSVVTYGAQLMAFFMF